jgi:hypothetical protein
MISYLRRTGEGRRSSCRINCYEGAGAGGLLLLLYCISCCELAIISYLRGRGAGRLQ